MKLLLILLFCLSAHTYRITYLIRNQRSNLGLHLGNEIKKNLINHGKVKEEEIILLSDMPDSHVRWWYFPIVEFLLEEMQKKETMWAMFLEEGGEVNEKGLRKLLTAYDPKKPWFLGESVLDTSPAIIHHYSMDKEMVYPDRYKGFLLSRDAVKKIKNNLTQVKQKWSFHIDAIFEFSKFLREKLDLPLTMVSMPSKYKNYLENFKAPINLQNNDVVVGVKTCAMYHENRIPITKKFWANKVENIYYYSDHEDESIPVIKTGIENSERGHCAKTVYIMKDLMEKKQDAKWYIITDDDTILNFDRLLERLSLYDPSEPYFLGERYGFALDPLSFNSGYNYITGGGGMYWTKPAFKKFVECEWCSCSPSEPDDMRLGIWARRLKVNLIHDPLFHQATPEHYHTTRLEGEGPAVSFHKHTGKVKPDKIFRDFLTDQKQEL